ncbi:MAG: hypothetical protein GY759_11955 [Chloroflexi bacterium]|nr:hypothetical protein [Chloroflexota bacterium]
MADYLNIIMRQDCEAEIFAGFLHFLTSQQAVSWEQINLCNLYETSLTYQRLPEMARQAGLRVEVEQEDVAPVLHLPANHEAYLAALNKKQRHEIRRKRRKLEREAHNWRWFLITGGADLPSDPTRY